MKSLYQILNSHLTLTIFHYVCRVPPPLPHFALLTCSSHIIICLYTCYYYHPPFFLFSVRISRKFLAFYNFGKAFERDITTCVKTTFQVANKYILICSCAICIWGSVVIIRNFLGRYEFFSWRNSQDLDQYSFKTYRFFSFVKRHWTLLMVVVKIHSSHLMDLNICIK